MSERDNQTILELYEQVQEFRERMFRLEGLLERLVNCPLIGNVALLVCSCRTTNESTSIRNLDRCLAWDRKVNVTLATTPKSLAKLAIPLDSLRKLPEGATFNNKSGQATASAAFKNDTLFVEASCDSLQNLVYQLEEKISMPHVMSWSKKELAKEPATTPFG